MGVRTIRLLGDAVLRQEARPVVDYGSALHRLLDDMAATMHKAEGIGLAANQIGILKRVVVADVGHGLIELINPAIISSSGDYTATERCLSVPGKRVWVNRYKQVTVRAQDRSGSLLHVEATDLLARCLQHEIDHLNGVLMIDRQVAPPMAVREGDDHHEHA